MKLSKASNQIKNVNAENMMNWTKAFITGTFVIPDIFESPDGSSPSSDIDATILI